MAEPIIWFEAVSKSYGGRPILKNFSLDVLPGELLTIIGRSGCGKTTALKLVNGLITPDAGRVLVQGEDVAKTDPVALRRRIGYAIQSVGLFPHMTVEKNIAYVPAISHLEGWKGPARRERVSALLRQVGLDPALADRYPRALSGGQRQRVGIARALALSPRLVVCDEPVSALDVSVQAQMLNLLADLQAARGLTYVLVSHDLGVVRHSADRVCVMFLGRVCEVGPTEALFTAPRHPYTRFLLDSVPRPDPTRRGEGRELLPGEIPSPVTPPSGCRFRTRCPYAAPVCAQAPPPLQGTGEHRVACHAPHGEG